MNHLSYDIASREIHEQLTPRNVPRRFKPADRRARRRTANALRRMAEHLDSPEPG